MNNKNNTKVQKVIHNERCGYSIILYERNKDNEIRDPEVRIHSSPVPTGVQRLKPAGKPVSCLLENEKPKSNVAEQYIRKRIVDQKVTDIHDTFRSINNRYKKAEKSDIERRELISPSVQNKLRGKSADEICEILLEDVMKNNDNVFSKNMERKIIKNKNEKKCLKKGKLPDAVIAVDKPSLEKLQDQVVEVIEELGGDSDGMCKCKCSSLLPKKLAQPLDPALERHKQQMDLLEQRQYELEMFERCFVALLKRLKNDIRNLEIKYTE